MREKVGVVLLNLGGPNTLADVEPFLFNLFSDRKIIRLGPWFMQKFIARRIARKRAPVSRESYRLIGGGSPLARITGEQGQALQQELASRGDFLVNMAMRYWQPTAREALAQMQEAGVSRVVALTLYPHYSVATTGSSVDDLLASATAGWPGRFDIAVIDSWPEQRDYVDCLAQTIRDGLAKFGGEEVCLLYSAHSLPVDFIEDGDPYVEEIEKTLRAVELLTGVPGVLCFQSRSGPVEWLEPSTPDMLKDAAERGCRNVLMVPISFVSDHVETLYEIDMLYRDQAKALGMRLERTESLNANPRFIKGLAELVLTVCGEKGWLDCSGSNHEPQNLRESDRRTT
ncbi:MAG: ferrochelatase [Desulfobulbaceae bacterium]|nr:ferrochelatase [Desulfobulbaceae bacterium]